MAGHSMLCKYKDSLGTPGRGIHGIRLMNLAVVDVLGTVALGWIVSAVWKIAMWEATCYMFLLGIILHRVFCVETTVDRFLFSSK